MLIYKLSTITRIKEYNDPKPVIDIKANLYKTHKTKKTTMILTVNNTQRQLAILAHGVEGYPLYENEKLYEEAWKCVEKEELPLGAYFIGAWNGISNALKSFLNATSCDISGHTNADYIAHHNKR